MNLHQINHTGKTVFVGIDVHKKTYAICAIADHLQKPFKAGNLPADPDLLVKKLKQYFQGAEIKSVYEAGFAGLKLHRTLIENGIENIVVDAASIEIAANNNVKTDKRDAFKMAFHRSKGLLTCIRIPSEEEELERQYTRTRKQLVKYKTSVGNQIKSKLYQFGYLKYDETRVMGPKLLKEFEEMKLPEELSTAIKSLSRIYRTVISEIKVMDEQIKKLSEKYEDIYKTYDSFPGVGAVSAGTLAAELGDMSQFHSEKQLYSFLGLTPSEYSSGEKIMKGKITKRGRSEVRSILIEVVWRAIGSDEYLKETYNNIKVRRGGKRAAVAMARRLAGMMRSCFKNNSYYISGGIETNKGQGTANQASTRHSPPLSPQCISQSQNHEDCAIH